MARWNIGDQGYQYNEGLHDVVMLSDKDGNVLNTSGAAANLHIAQGLVGGVGHINKFGYNASIGAGDEETIWDGNGLYVYPTTATVASVAGNATDTGAVVNVQGLDGTGLQVDEDVAVGGTSTILFKRVFRARLVSHPTLTTNDGDITITVDGVSAAIIKATKGQTLMALYTIPTGKTGFLLQFQGTVDKSKFAIFNLAVRNGGDVFNTKGQFGTFGTPVPYNYPVPLKFSEGSDIEYRAACEATMGAGAVFDLLLVDNA